MPELESTGREIRMKGRIGAARGIINTLCVPGTRDAGDQTNNDPRLLRVGRRSERHSRHSEERTGTPSPQQFPEGHV